MTEMLMVEHDGELIGFVEPRSVGGIVRWRSWRPEDLLRGGRYERGPVGMHQDMKQAEGFLRQLAAAAPRRGDSRPPGRVGKRTERGPHG